MLGQGCGNPHVWSHRIASRYKEVVLDYADPRENFRFSRNGCLFTQRSVLLPNTVLLHWTVFPVGDKIVKEEKRHRRGAVISQCQLRGGGGGKNQFLT